MKDTRPSEYRNTFETVAGAKVLEDLRREFYDTNITCGTPEATTAAAAAHDVVRYVLDMIEDGAV